MEGLTSFASRAYALSPDTSILKCGTALMSRSFGLRPTDVS